MTMLNTIAIAFIGFFALDTGHWLGLMFMYFFYLYVYSRAGPEEESEGKPSKKIKKPPPATPERILDYRQYIIEFYQSGVCRVMDEDMRVIGDFKSESSARQHIDNHILDRFESGELSIKNLRRKK